MENTDGNIGRILKERREELGLTLQNAEQDTRIRRTYLESLENNQFSDLPGQTYVTGFIRVYANYLGLKSNPLLAILKDLQGVEPKPEAIGPTVGIKPVQRVQNSAGINWRKFLLVFVLIILLGVLAYFFLTIFSSNEQATGSATEASKAGLAPAVSMTPQAELEKSPEAPEKTQTSEAMQTRSTESEGQLPALVAAPPVASVEQPVQDNRNFPTIPSNGASLRMLALADSSLIIKVDERKPQQYKLYDGLDLTWKIKQKVNVEFAATDVARFWLNGQEIDITGNQSFTLQPAAE